MEEESVSIKDLKEPPALISIKSESRNEDVKIFFGFFVITALYAILIIGLFIFLGLGTIEAYKSTPGLMLTTILISLRMAAMLGFSYFMFKRWFAQEKRYMKNIPFLVGLFFYFLVLSKPVDIVIYIHGYEGGGFPSYTDANQMILCKIRFFLIIITFLPMLYLGLRPVLYNFGIEKGWDDTKVLKIRKGIIGIYVGLFSILIILVPNILIIQGILIFMYALTNLFICWVFRFAHKHNTFPTIRADIVSWGFLMYLINSASRFIFRYVYENNMMSIELYIIIPEIIDFISILVIIIGFTLKPK